METVFISKLKPFVDAVAGSMELYVPRKSGKHYIFSKYQPTSDLEIEFNNVRSCSPVKEFLFPSRQLVATYPVTSKAETTMPFAVFGLKDCDLRSIKILDKVFDEAEFRDAYYLDRRDKIFLISTDCFDISDSCFCNLFGSKGCAENGYDLNVAKTKDGFIIQAGSKKGQKFIEDHRSLFADVPDALLAEREENRKRTQGQLAKNNAKYQFKGTLKEIVEKGQNSELFDEEAKGCVECQACTRICPTCHCFYLYDDKQKDYFTKMKMWDSCMRFSYATVAGGENPNKLLRERIKHRLLHKFVHFLDRYGIDMCVGCGRCIDGEAGRIDLREILKKLSNS